MHRNDLLFKLNGYKPIDNDDAQTLKQFKEFVNAHENCFDRSLKIGHVTGSAWIVNPARDAVLLTHHRKLNKWVQLGGHTDRDPDTLQAALREAREESGINTITPLSDSIFDLDIHPIPARGGEPEHLHYDVRYAFEVDGDATYTVSSESIDLEWALLDQLDRYSEEPSLLRMKQKWLLSWLDL